ncbi:hypothetical protein NXU83_14065 [Bacteroides thetaiotaomicron]|jgi:hypothetical protein|uniref:hypothetical protein n=1 Tax=Bacteroides thetaiotaomicron TaxID=818 RepID=UPI00216533D5|nr:hypothetical protein [Bacteroides thetaiotaomicron]MCS3182649.1 hypothetical protein [Bacteroides thetaiotaomicron]
MENINDIIQRYDESGRSLVESHYVISKDILIASASLLGILISLTNTTNDCYWARVFFVLSLVLLSLGILMIGVAMFSKLSTERYRLSRTMWILNCIKDNVEYSEPNYKKRRISFYTALIAGIILIISSMVTLVVFIAIRNEIFNYPSSGLYA